MSEALTLNFDNYLDIGINANFDAIQSSKTSISKREEVYEVIEPKNISDIKNEIGTLLVKTSNIEIPIELLKKKTRELTIAHLADKEDNFITERKQLVLKEITNGLTRNEKIKIKYLTWLLDRIEDAQNGEFLDHLEKLVNQQEKIANSVLSNIDLIKSTIDKMEK